MNKRFVPQVLGLEKRLTLDGSAVAVPGDTGDYSITMEPEPYGYADWLIAFANALENLDEAIAEYIDPDDSYIDDAYASPTYVQP